MAHLHTKSLHRQATDLLSRQEDAPKKLVLFHTLIALGIPLLVVVVNVLLVQQIAKTGGLGGMGTRTILETVQSILSQSAMILLPFWNIGLIFAAMAWRKGQAADKSHLVEGFRRFVNLFAMWLWTAILLFAVGFAALYVSSLIFSATPWSKPFMDLLSPNGEIFTPEQLQAMMTPELTQQLLVKMRPMFIIFGVLVAAVGIFLFYRLRFAQFILLEGEGGIRALLGSFRLTRGSGWQIFKLDVHFWWFYLLQGLALVICNGDMLLPLCGVTLPMDRNLSILLFYAAGILLEGILFYLFQGARLTTYALAYDALHLKDPTILPDDLLQEA